MWGCETAFKKYDSSQGGVTAIGNVWYLMKGAMVIGEMERCVGGCDSHQEA